MNKIFCFLGCHKWIEKHYHNPEEDYIMCDGNCWCVRCGFARDIII